MTDADLSALAARALAVAGDGAQARVLHERRLRPGARREQLVVEVAIVRDGRVGVARTTDASDAGLAAAAAGAAAACGSDPCGGFPGWPEPAPGRPHDGWDPAVARLDALPAGLAEARAGRVAIASSTGVAAAERRTRVIGTDGYAATGPAALEAARAAWPAGPATPAHPAALAGSLEPADPGAPAGSFEPADPGAPAGSFEPADPGAPAGSFESAEPTAPAPFEPAEPAAGTAAPTPAEPAAGTAAPLPDGEYRAVLSPAAVAVLLDALGRLAFDGLAVHEGRSPLAGRLGTRVAASAINLSESPRFGGTLPRSYDAEGVPVSPLPLIQDGVAHRVVHDTRSAALAGAVSTGHAARPAGGRPRPRNLVLVGGGASTEAELLAPVADGVYLTRLRGLQAIGADTVTALARGYRVTGGELGPPLAPVRFTGSPLAVLAAVEALSMRQRLAPSGTVCPALRAGGLRLGAA